MAISISFLLLLVRNLHHGLLAAVYIAKPKEKENFQPRSQFQAFVKVFPQLKELKVGS